MNTIIACIDGSPMAKAVCEAAIWSAQRLNKPLLFLHTIEKKQQHGADDLTGAIGLGAQSSLLEEMALLDEQRGKLALEHGKNILAAAVSNAESAGLIQVEKKQRHGDIVEALTELESEARLMVVGRSGEGHSQDFKTLGSHIESLIRTVHTPVLLVPQAFQKPNNFMLAYDGRPTADKAIEKIITGGLLKGLACHLVMVKNNETAQKEKLERAKSQLLQEGFDVKATYLEGNIFDSLARYKIDNSIDLMVMGAFAHSKVRQLFLGSNTMRMIENICIPLIILR